jgi:RimJ/RimL family protein N-acetyltransferase
VILEPFLPTYLGVLEAWLRQPHVARWYPTPEENLTWATAPPAGGHQAIIVRGEAGVGYLRWQQVDRATLDELGLWEVPEGSVDADILIGSEGMVGRGIGPAALLALAAKIRRDPSVAMIGLTSELENTRAHRAFEKAGFRIARQYEVPSLGVCHLMLLDLRGSSGAIADTTVRYRAEDASTP